MNYVIIGGSAAGAQAAEELRAHDPDASISLFSDEAVVPYSRCLLSRYADGRVTEKGLYFKTDHFFEDNGIDGYIGTKITHINRGNKTVTTETGENIPYDKLLLATGSNPWAPDIPGNDLNGVYHFHKLSEVKKILSEAEKAEQIVIVGAGFIGLEAAYSLKKLGKAVTVVERSSQILPIPLDGPSSRIIQKDLEEWGVEIILNESVFSINGEGDIHDVSLGDKSRLPADLVIIAAGVRPNKELAADAGLETGQGVLVDDFMQTSDPDIYAAGDIIEIEDVSTGVRTVSATWYNAVLQGKYAAYNMAGKRRRYIDTVGIQNAVQFHHVPAISYGLTRIDPEKHSTCEVMSIHKDGVYRKLVLNDNHVTGMIFVGNIEKSGFYAALIRHRVDISPFKEKLLDDDFGFAYLRENRFGQYDPFQAAAI